MQGSISSTTCHVVYAFLVTTLIGLLQVKYQNKNVSPFETHPSTIQTFVMTMCSYSLATVGKSITKKYDANCSKIFGHVSTISGALSSVSLAVIFLKTSLSSLIMFIIWAILFATMARYLYQKIYQWFYQMSANAVVQVLDLYTSFMRRRSSMEQHRFQV
ncbi:hypothetical protein RHGRI_019265 [Rhododendron griersonianum]|uniref:Transmembrane protein n=1 Tax=Rhododendron griersonianum TaxID=479676 RepID=A0AAV6JG84_9ERIC|nr:hypothetical protein RHGRI_019265 [Rhododendron griersonianum]